MKKIKRLLMLVVAALILTVSCAPGYTVYADDEDDYLDGETTEYDDPYESYEEDDLYMGPSANEGYTGLGYVLDSYHIDMVVNEDNTFDITETIGAYFFEPKHGIFRKIPLSNEVTRLDGSKSKNRAMLTDITVDHPYQKYREEGNTVIKIGDADRTLTGPETYVISYKYNIGKDPLKDADELYFNLIGTEWDTVIGNITFSIEMPKDFDPSSLGFSYGPKGSAESENVTYEVNGTTITGRLFGELSFNEGLTVRLTLPEGYFVGAGFPFHIWYYLPLLVPVIGLLIAFLLWYLFGRDDKVIETVEFYPPDGMNSLEVGFAYKAVADNQDAVSLLLHLANQGYIQISEYEKKALFGKKKKDFMLKKLKEYEGTDENEKLFFDGLFKTSPLVTSEDLYDSFYVTINKILRNVNTKENRNKLMMPGASGKGFLMVLFIIASFVAITVPPFLVYGEPEMIPVALIFPGVGLSVIVGMLLSGGKKSCGFLLFILIWGGMFAGLPWVALMPGVLSMDVWYMIGYIVGILCIIGMMVFLKLLPKRTPYGTQILGRIKGFKNFLEVAEKERLEALVSEDPNYFYNILPYTYVLGVSDKWVKKFETIAMQAPSWYDSPDFNMAAFGTFMNSTMSSARTAMTSSPSDSSGGGSGGGSSGGGSGGGGGGSW